MSIQGRRAALALIVSVRPVGALQAQDTALSTDRPGQLFSAQVVGPGVWQLESRIAHTGDEEGDDLGLFGAGVTYLMSEDPQLDAAFDAGLTDAAPDLQVGVGLSVRF